MLECLGKKQINEYLDKLRKLCKVYTAAKNLCIQMTYEYGLSYLGTKRLNELMSAISEYEWDDE